MTTAESQTEPESGEGASGPNWQPLGRDERRVLGVLIEKAKTTPDAYPMTINAIVTASNQKSNRNPQLQLEREDIEVAIDRLRELGALVEIQGDGRVSKYRHKSYQWLGVEKVELAIVAELMLRGEQTVGDLRGRAARMEPIADLNEMRPILESLVSKGLVVELSPRGRGQLVTHALYPPDERPAPTSSVVAASPSREESVKPNDVQEIRDLLDRLESRVASLEAQLASLSPSPATTDPVDSTDVS